MSRTAAELAQYLDATLAGDSQARISGVASPEKATPEDLIYVDSRKQFTRAEASAARCAILSEGLTIAGKTLLAVKEPKLAFAKAAAWLAPREAPKPGIHPTAVIAATAQIAAGVFIGPYVVVEDDAAIGRDTVIEAFCFVGRSARIGESCWLHPHVTLYAGSKLGAHVELHSGVVIGGDGFGYVYGEGRHWKFPQIGTVEIGDRVEIGCNTTVDRGSLGDTVIETEAKIDNLVQVAHNVRIGEGTLIASQVGISGSCTIGKRVMIGGQAGFGEHCAVEDGAIIGGQSGILPGKIVRSGQIVWGTPVRSLEKFKEQFAWSARLPELAERLEKLEKSQAQEDSE
jgi:UDP-3-O-[3-hydroxymyristoyl] glucosamine N-acyltransferase